MTNSFYSFLISNILLEERSCETLPLPAIIQYPGQRYPSIEKKAPRDGEDVCSVLLYYLSMDGGTLATSVACPFAVHASVNGTL
jgi:hypothetical protein